ncbi:hypothetical protein NLI96_g12642 [Meripilus lineatus]|uniref:Reverse transcriptase Ty1/copia-type domain-containing protein n=1 Tax=Meripilus lineatus TaxID=2056292 RepID=A0AAD5UPJ0_9APHY|nr:hypothetical protein NLI96_g12642 [Physisporinus lineatus]
MLTLTSLKLPRHWIEATQKEFDGLIANGTWEYCQLPPGAKAIGCRWVLNIKHLADGTIDRYKARLVAQGFSQRPGFDYVETFAPTVRMATIRVILALAALEDLELYSIDISQAFLNGDLDVDIYMQQPEGFERGNPGDVVRLVKGLYGLKQAGRLWNQKLHSVLLQMGFKRLKSDASVYLFIRDDVRVIIPIFIDDITLAGRSVASIKAVIAELATHFKLRDLGPSSYLLGIEITRNRSLRSLSLSQRQYIINTLTTFSMFDCNPVSTPMDPGLSLSAADGPQTDSERQEMSTIPYINAVGALMYLSTCIRPDISYTVHKLARFNTNPGMAHWKAVKHLFRYLKGTMDLTLTYSPNPHSTELFRTFSDADHAGEVDSRKSTGGFVVMIGTGAVSWSSKLQSMVGLSTTEAEFVAGNEAGKELMWIRNLLTEIGYTFDGPSTLFMDNNSAISVAKNPTHHSKMKHVDLRLHWLRDMVESGYISPVHLSTHDMPADLLTKALPRVKVQQFRGLMGLQG